MHAYKVEAISKGLNIVIYLDKVGVTMWPISYRLYGRLLTGCITELIINDMLQIDVFMMKKLTTTMTMISRGSSSYLPTN